MSAYDDQKRATDWAVTGGLSSTAHRDFDGAGHEATQTDTGLSGPVTYTYGDDGRKSHDHLPFALGGTLDAAFAYTADGRLATATAAGASTATFAYDSAGDVATYTATIDGSGTTTSGVLAYDTAGRLSSRTTTGGATLETFGFDTAHGWRTSQRRSGEASATYGYDDAGHLTSYHRPANSQGTTYAVDVAYSYDALGQRSSSVVTTGSVTTTTTWTYDGLTLDSLAATSSLGATWSVTYLYDSEGRPFAGVYRSSTSSPTEFGILTTDRGDVAELTDANGDAFAAYRYDAWGRPLSVASTGTGALPSTLASDIASRQPLRYAGYVFDSESGTYYCSARSYDPATMQFLQKDPAKADGEESAYQYCGGDPVGATDGSGQSWSQYNIFGRHLSGGEIALACTFPASALVIFGAANDAWAMTRRLWPGDKGKWSDDPADAFRHAYWNALGVKRLYLIVGWHTPWTARVAMSWFASAHEDFATNIRLSKTMDLYNNRVGRAIGMSYYKDSDYGLAEKVVNAMLAHNLVFITKKHTLHTT